MIHQIDIEYYGCWTVLVALAGWFGLIVWDFRPFRLFVKSALYAFIVGVGAVIALTCFMGSELWDAFDEFMRRNDRRPQPFELKSSECHREGVPKAW